MATAVMHQGCGHVEGNPKVGGSGKIKPRKHNANQGVGFAIELHSAAEEASVAAKITLPKTVARNRHVILASGVFAIRKGPARERLDTHGRKEIGLRGNHGDRLWDGLGGGAERSCKALG